jgi:hypothetical protein
MCHGPETDFVALLAFVSVILRASNRKRLFLPRPIFWRAASAGRRLSRVARYARHDTMTIAS